MVILPCLSLRRTTLRLSDRCKFLLLTHTLSRPTLPWPWLFSPASHSVRQTLSYSQLSLAPDSTTAQAPTSQTLPLSPSQTPERETLVQWPAPTQAGHDTLSGSARRHDYAGHNVSPRLPDGKESSGRFRQNTCSNAHCGPGARGTAPVRL